MTIYRKYTPTEIEAMAESLKQQLSDGILPEDLLELFKFRGPEGHTWTVEPRSGAWYWHQSGGWQKTKAPDIPLDGPNDLLGTVALPLDPLETELPEEDEPVQKDEDLRQMLEGATQRVKESYVNGKISSAGAETLLKDLYLLDPSGLIWSYGFHSQAWYFFRQDDWEMSVEAGPDPQDFQALDSGSPLECSNCGASLNGGKFCSECGTRAPDPGSPYPEAAREVVVRFTESDAASLPEPIVPDWDPAPGLPGTQSAGASTPTGEQKSPSELPPWDTDSSGETKEPAASSKEQGSVEKSPSAASTSPPKKRSRIILLAALIFLAVTCSCCGVLALIGMFNS